METPTPPPSAPDALAPAPPPSGPPPAGPGDGFLHRPTPAGQPAAPPSRTPPSSPLPPAARMPEVVPIALDHPVEVDGVTVEALSMRRPRVADQLAVEKTGRTEGAREVALFANLCQVSPETLRRLALSDYFEMQRVFKGFLSRRRPTSAAPSRS